jgi:mannitol-specific phosphotransferase system IIBC component
MKQKDIALVIVIVAVSGVVSFFVSRLLFTSGGKHEQKVEVVQAITTDFNAPSTKYFNSSAIDPTQTIQIGQDTNPAPFSTH